MTKQFSWSTFAALTLISKNCCHSLIQYVFLTSTFTILSLSVKLSTEETWTSCVTQNIPPGNNATGWGEGGRGSGRGEYSFVKVCAYMDKEDANLGAKIQLYAVSCTFILLCTREYNLACAARTTYDTIFYSGLTVIRDAVFLGRKTNVAGATQHFHIIIRKPRSA